MSNNVITSYKGFDKDLKCRGFQYEVGKEYEMDDDIEVCIRGFHACEFPLEVLDHYTIFDDDLKSNRFCEVEQYGEISKENSSTKICSSKIKIKAELKLADLINLGVEWIKEQVKFNCKEKVLSDNASNLAKIGSSGDSAKIGSSGNLAKIGTSGDYAKIGSSGDSAKIGSSGNLAQIGTSGNYAQIGTSGDYAKIGTSGDYAKIGSSGNLAKIGTSGDYAKIGTSGNSAKIGSSGNLAKIGSSGDYAKIESTGEDCVICCAGHDSVAKAKIGSWITLSEWIYSDDKKRYIPNCVKTEYVDGERVKEDTWYKLIDGEFKEI